MKPKTSRAIAGTVALAPRPTPFGAAVVAAIVTFPIGVVILLVDVLLT